MPRPTPDPGANSPDHEQTGSHTHAHASAPRWALRFCTALATLSLVGLGWLALGRLHPNVPPPESWMRAIVIILVSGGIGFGTNWLAIKMLFRPREPVPWLLVWQQGLLPREQQRLAQALGRVAASRLLKPDAIVEGLNDERLRAPLGRALRDELEAALAQPETRDMLTTLIAQGLKDHGPAVVRRMRPQLRAAMEQAIDRHITAERILEWMRAAVHRFATNPEMRKALARWIIRQTAREGIMVQVMDIVREQFYRYRERNPIRGFLAEQFVIDWDDLREGLLSSLQTEETTEDLARILIDAAGSVMERLHDEDTEAVVAAAREAIVERALDWAEHEGLNALADRVGAMGDSPETWGIVEEAIDEMIDRVPAALFDPESGTLRPAVRERLNRLQSRVIESFPVAEVVERQVLLMDPAAVESMVDEIGRRELASIQILGMVLGIIAGAVLFSVL